MDSDETGRSGKRWKVQQEEERYGHDDEYEVPPAMELDEYELNQEIVERGRRESLSPNKRNQKRSEREEDRSGDEDWEEVEPEARVTSKRSRRASPVLGASRKRRTRGSGSDSDSLFDPVEEKKAKAGGRGKPTSKRDIEDVEDSSDEEDQVRGPRNADSDADDDDEAESEDAGREGKRSRRRDSKRSRASEEQFFEEEDLMDGTFEDMSTIEHPPPSPPSTTRRRTLPPSSLKKKKSKVISNRARRSPSRTSFENSSKPGMNVGDEWVDMEGDKYKIDEEGVKRRLCEVREWRKKYKMVSRLFCCLLPYEHY